MYAFSQHSPSPDEFADLVADSLLKRGAFSGEFLFDRTKFALLIKNSDPGGERKICLSQLYREYCAGDVVTRQKILMSASSRSNIQKVQEPVRQSAQSNPEIVTRWSVELRQLSNLGRGTGLHGEVGSELKHEIFADHFAVSFSDSEHSNLEMEQIPSIELLSAQAIEKLAPANERWFESLNHDYTGEVVLHMSTSRDRFETTRRPFSKEIELLPVSGERLVFIINPTYLIVTGSDCERGLMYAHAELKLASEEASSYRSYPPVPLLLRDGEYYRYSIPRSSLWHKSFRELELRYLNDTYRKQKQTLDDDILWREAGYELSDYDLSRNERGVLLSTCRVNARALPVLVPSTDYICMFHRDGLAASATMDRVRLICPALLQETGFYPTRYLMSKMAQRSRFSGYRSRRISPLRVGI